MFYAKKDGALEYLQAESLAGCVHCFSTRFGGVSSGIYESLNLGTHRGDAFENVLENYQILGAAVGFVPEDTVFPKQRHTDVVLAVTKADRGTGLFCEQQTVCDALVTNEPDVALVCFTADCTPVLLFDPVARAIAAVHAGWRGTASGIVKKAAETMTALYGSRPEHIRAAIGPCISRCHFETDRDVPDAMRDALGQAAEGCIEQHGEKYYVNLKELNRLWLLRAGVLTIDLSDDCTACQPQRFWSHRTVGDARGSQAAVIMLSSRESL